MKEIIKRFSLPTPAIFIKLRKILVALGFIIAILSWFITELNDVPLIANNINLEEIKLIGVSLGLLISKLSYLLTKLPVDWEEVKRKENL